MKINLKTKLQEAIDLSPAVSEVFTKKGLYCLTCHGIAQDTIAHVAINNGLDPEEFLKELNSVLK